MLITCREFIELIAISNKIGTDENGDREGRTLAARIANPYPSVSRTASITVPVWQPRPHHTQAHTVLKRKI